MELSKDAILKKAAEAAENGNHQPAPPVQPQPVPTMVSVGQSQLQNGELAVVLVVHSPTGQGIYFLDSDSAKNVADGLLRAAMAVKSNLVVPN